MALRSAVVEGQDIARPFVALSRAATMAEAQAAVDRWSGTTFNFVLASTDDRIAYRFVGDVPARDPGAGLLPQSGATSPGPPPFVPAAQLPRLDDPAEGVIVSANNAPGGPHELGEEWCEPRRWERIQSLLAERPLHDVASFCAVQTDGYSANLVTLRDLLIERGLRGDRLHELITRWDGHLRAGDPAAALMHLAYRLLAMDLLERVAGPLGRVALGEDDGTPMNSAYSYRAQGMLVQATVEAGAPWFRDAADRDRRLVGFLARAAEVLEQECGPDPALWRLGRLQELQFRHELHAIPLIGALWARGSYPFAGDANTIVQAQGDGWGERTAVRVAPGYRQVVDLADWDRSVFMLPSGISGIPGHPRYDDCIEEYVAGTYRPLLFTEPAVRDAAEAVLVLDRALEREEGGA